MAYGTLNKLQISAFNVPTVVYTAPAEAVVDLFIANTVGIPVFVNVAIAAAAIPTDDEYIVVHKVVAPNIAAYGSTIRLEKLVLNTGENLVVTLLEPEDEKDYHDGVIFTINTRVQGIDGTDLTTARYSY